VDNLPPSLDRLLSCARAATARRPVSQRVQDLSDLARELGWSSQRIHNMKTRGVSKDGALEAEAVLGCPASYVLEGGTIPLFAGALRLVANEKTAVYEVAHAVNHLPLEAVPLLTREQLLTEHTPELFAFAAPDDAMAPEAPAGTEIVWTTRRRIAPGRLVLLRDEHQQLHVRRCQQGEGPGAWVGAVTNSAYRSMRSDEPGLRVLAVYKGRLEPDDA